MASRKITQPSRKIPSHADSKRYIEEASRHSVAIIGAGPRGIGLLERLCTTAPDLMSGRALTVHLVDPFPPGPGRVWRSMQSPLLQMNSRVQDVTMYDPAVTGLSDAKPSLLDWVEAIRAGRLRADIEPSLLAEMNTIASGHFATRRLLGAYLDWCFREILTELPDMIKVRTHTASAIDVTGEPDGPQRVRLDTGLDLFPIDAVVFTIGLLEAEPDRQEQDMLDFATRHGAKYMPSGFTTDLELSDIGSGDTVLVRGFGLACTDLMVLLTEGRGGEFSTTAGQMVYKPSGAEPRLYVGSRRGVPYLPKPSYSLPAMPAALPRFFGPREVSQLAARQTPLDFWSDVWPLMAKEIGWGYYHELFISHPDRVRIDFDEFTERYTSVDHASDDLRALIEQAVPDETDRLDLHTIDRPLEELLFTHMGELAERLEEHIENMLYRRTDAEFSAELGAFNAVLSAGYSLTQLVATGAFAVESQIRDVNGWWSRFNKYFTAGPPPRRLRELMALSRAGIVSFLGPDMWVRTDECTGAFHAGGSAHPVVVTATCLVEARLSKRSLPRVVSPLLRTLYARGEIQEEQHGAEGSGVASGRICISATDYRLIDKFGGQHPRRFALGPYTSVNSPSPFIKSSVRGVPFQENNTLAGEILRILASQSTGWFKDDLESFNQRRRARIVTH